MKVVCLMAVLFISFSIFLCYYKPAWATVGISPLSYCELGKHPERYHQKFVRVKAPIAGDELLDYYLYNADCDFGIQANMTALQFDSSLILDPGLKSWLLKLKEGQSFTQKLGHSAVLTGWFDAEFSPGCWGPRFSMHVIKIEPVS